MFILDQSLELGSLPNYLNTSAVNAYDDNQNSTVISNQLYINQGQPSNDKYIKDFVLIY